jgi:hypothetical protein
MSLPTYDSASLAAAMHAWLGPTAASLGWSVEGGNYTEPIIDTLLMYGDVTDVAEMTDIRKTRALALVAAWRAAVSALVPRVNWSRQGESVSGSQEHTAALKQLQAAIAEAVAGGYITPASGTLRTFAITRGNDIYGVVRTVGSEL